MNIGFTVVQQPTEVEGRISAPPTRGDADLLTFSRRGDSFALLMGHLYYRNDLRSQLDSAGATAAPHVCGSNDAALVLTLYGAYGATVLEHLEGDFALVLWDAARHQLLGTRDPMGGYPLFWLERGDTRAFSTRLQPLLALLPRRELNCEYFAHFIMMPLQATEATAEACAYTGIQRVLPGTIVTLGGLTARVRRDRYWCWADRIDDPGTGDATELAQHYKAVLQAAVRERISGRTLAHLSGGMDSTSVALLARDLVGAGVGKAPLHTLSFVYDRLRGLARERPYIEAVLQRATGIVAHRVNADHLLDYDSFRDPPAHDEPYPGLWRLPLDRATIEVAAEVGAATVLTGIGADEIHAIPPFYLADLLRQGRVCKAWQEATTWALARNCSPWAILRQFAPVSGTWLWRSSSLIGKWLRPGPVKLSEQDDWSVPPWIAPEFARRYALRTRAMENARSLSRLHPNRTVSITLSTLAHRAGDFVRWAVAAPLGIRVRHPFLDQRLLALGLGLQLRVQPEPGRAKPVLAEVMRDILPAAILERRSKGDFNEVYYLGLSRNLQQLERLIAEAPEVAWTMFDQASLLRSLREASLATAGARQLQRLDYTLALICWLQGQEGWNRRQGQVTQRIHVGLNTEGGA
jgi:asparagine synthase (glutamine-hydrolysing)